MDQEEQLAIRRFPTAAFEAALQPLTQVGVQVLGTGKGGLCQPSWLLVSCTQGPVSGACLECLYDAAAVGRCCSTAQLILMQLQPGCQRASMPGLPNPPELSHPPLVQLTRLELERCFLEQVPDCIASLTRLCHLDLYRNDIKRIPDELFSHLQQLTHLGLAGNAFVGLPHSLGALPQLAELNLSDNSWLRDLPPGSYPALKDLRLADCIFLQSG